MSTDLNLNDPALRANAVKAARGLRAFDKLVRNALMLDMVTGRERAVDIVFTRLIPRAKRLQNWTPPVPLSCPALSIHTCTSKVRW
jgi:hypothetical protein